MPFYAFFLAKSLRLYYHIFIYNSRPILSKLKDLIFVFFATNLFNWKTINNFGEKCLNFYYILFFRIYSHARVRVRENFIILILTLH